MELATAYHSMCSVKEVANRVGSKLLVLITLRFGLDLSANTRPARGDSKPPQHLRLIHSLRAAHSMACFEFPRSGPMHQTMNAMIIDKGACTRLHLFVSLLQSRCCHGTALSLGAE